MKEYELIRSDRRTIAIEIRSDGRLIVRAPVNMPIGKIEEFIIQKSSWIDKHLAQAEQKTEVPKFTREEIDSFANMALIAIPMKVRYYADILGVKYGRITIRNQRSRWGSCSSAGNLNFNCLLMLAPQEVVDYVIVHELCHRIEMNHSKRFWDTVASVIPDYEDHRRWLKNEGSKLIERL